MSPEKGNGRASVLDNHTGPSLIRDSSITKIDMSVRIEGTKKEVQKRRVASLVGEGVNVHDMAFGG